MKMKNKLQKQDYFISTFIYFKFFLFINFKNQIIDYHLLLL